MTHHVENSLFTKNSSFLLLQFQFRRNFNSFITAFKSRFFVVYFCLWYLSRLSWERWSAHRSIPYEFELSLSSCVCSIHRVDLDTLSSISVDSSAGPHATAVGGKVVQIVKLEEFKNIYILVPIFNCFYSCVVRGWKWRI